ncbi:hypothetical protein M9H77_07429 [Catharanthus roseus]|uniref:Uncharacterized protein n=1 Tax=Catharanthus roseus TaxID=4058 RepID=A0ACC0BV50_CATRO|nr:hypothetical protein M9H77_07429 [Catharanthus roseus]
MNRNTQRRNYKSNSKQFRANDMNRESQEAKDLFHGPFSSARPKKRKDNNGNEVNGMVSYMEEALKNKLEGRFFIKGGVDLGKVLNQIYNRLKIHIKVVTEQLPNESQFVIDKIIFFEILTPQVFETLPL